MENAKKPRAIPAWAIAAALVLGLAASGALAWALEEAVAAPESTAGTPAAESRSPNGSDNDVVAAAVRDHIRSLAERGLARGSGTAHQVRRAARPATLDASAASEHPGPSMADGDEPGPTDLADGASAGSPASPAAGPSPSADEGAGTSPAPAPDPGTSEPPAGDPADSGTADDRSEDDAGGGNGASEPKPPAPAAPEPGMAARSLNIGGAIIPYRDVRGGTTPDSGAGLWLGSDDTTDGSWGYFVGHNPGSFSPVKGLGVGSTVILCDNAGRSRTYTVRTVFTAEVTATWKTIAARVTGYGESIVLQTCSGDGATNIIVVAA